MSGRAVVLKWGIPVDDQTHIQEWPEDARAVHVAPHPERVDLVLVWTLSSSDTKRLRNLRVYGTGQPIDLPAVHLGTAVTHVGLVWHLMELT